MNGLLAGILLNAKAADFVVGLRHWHGLDAGLQLDAGVCSAAS